MSPVCSLFQPVVLHYGRQSLLVEVDCAKLREKRNEKEDAVEDEEKDPVGPTQVEPAQRDNDEGQGQRQTQRPCENPRQQTLQFKLRRRRRQKITFLGLKRLVLCTFTKSWSGFL